MLKNIVDNILDIVEDDITDARKVRQIANFIAEADAYHHRGMALINDDEWPLTDLSDWLRNRFRSIHGRPECAPGGTLPVPEHFRNAPDDTTF